MRPFVFSNLTDSTCIKHLKFVEVDVELEAPSASPDVAMLPATCHDPRPTTCYRIGQFASRARITSFANDFSTWRSSHVEFRQWQNSSLFPPELPKNCRMECGELLYLSYTVIYLFDAFKKIYSRSCWNETKEFRGTADGLLWDFIFKNFLTALFLLT